MRGSFHLKETFLLAVIFFISLESFSQNVLLLIDEEKREMVVLKKKQISDILTLDHEYLGDAIRLWPSGIRTQRKVIPIDSVHSLIVNNGNFGNALGFPLKVAGSGLALLGSLVMLSSKETETDAFDNEQNDANLGQLIGGGVLVGLGVGAFYLGSKAGDRKIEKEKSTYYLHQWETIVTDRKNIKRYKSELKK